MQKDNAKKIYKIAQEAKANHKANDIQLEATKRAQTPTQHQLKQAKEAINKYMTNPIVDPTIDMAKDA